jgi:hypothetical protein
MTKGKMLESGIAKAKSKQPALSAKSKLVLANRKRMAFAII